MKQFITLIFLAFFAWSVQAQTRYLDEVFSDVQVTPDVTYGVNATLLYFTVFNQAIPEALKCDIYEPVGDTASVRPLVVYLHTGNFGPFQDPATGAPGFNGSCGGTRKDSAAVAMCTQLAKMGYTVASVSYRLGWEPTNPDELRRRFSLINAAYRGVQDGRTAIRYFRKTAAEAGNPYNVDTSRIVVWGQGTGGYISYAMAILDDYNKIPTASGGKFLWQPPGAPSIIPMVIESINGNIDGTTYGVSNSPVVNDTLNYPNHVGYSSDFDLMVNLGGAMADTAWLEPGQVPMISFQVPTDPFAPYTEGILTVPGVNYQVVLVQGAYDVQNLADQFGINDVFKNAPVTLDLAAEQQNAFDRSPAGLNDLRTGLYPLITGGGADSAPWEWSAEVPGNPTCTLDRNRALTYIDTIMRFYAPRACFALGLQSCISKIVGVNDPIDPASVELSIFPNPAVSEVNFSAADNHPIQTIQLFDTQGRMVREINGIGQAHYILQRQTMASGLYIAKIGFEEGFVTEMVKFD